MPTKRTYMQSGPAAKRSKTLTQEVAKLKKQVSQNKHELKYFDGEVVFSTSVSDLENSFITKALQPANAQFVGRKVYVHKIEYRYTLPSNAEAMIYRCKKQVVNASTTDYPHGLDPEFHTMLRYSEQLGETTRQAQIGTIDFKNAPRLVEFDQPAEELTANITKGDIRFYSNSAGRSCTYRLWYHDG